MVLPKAFCLPMAKYKTIKKPKAKAATLRRSIYAEPAEEHSGGQVYCFGHRSAIALGKIGNRKLYLNVSV